MDVARRLVLPSAVIAAVLAAAPVSRADDGAKASGGAKVSAGGTVSAGENESEYEHEHEHDYEPLHRIIDRPHTVAEVEGGIIALPGAPISPGQRGGDTPLVGRIGRGDATLQTGIHVLYRPTRSWIIGAGAIFAPRPTSDNEYGGLSLLKRTHARSYLFLGGEGRYVPIHVRYFEAWVGVSGGAIIVADRFSTESGDPVPAIVGVPDVTIRTEGFAVGVQLGGSYYLSENWIFGANVRGYQWVLPNTRACSSIGDCATLGGSVQVFEFGLTIGYLLPLNFL